MVQAAVTAMIAVATVTGAGMIVPQVIALHRSRTVDGVSAAWIGVGVAMNLWWIAYAAQAGVWGIVPVSALGLALYVVLAVQVLRLVGSGALPDLVLGGMFGQIPLAVLVVGGWPAAAVTIGLMYSVQFLPAVISALRSTSVAGVSVATWGLAFVEAAIWLVYGVMVADVALVLGGGGGSVMSAVILLALRRRSQWPELGAVDPLSPVRNPGFVRNLATLSGRRATRHHQRRKGEHSTWHQRSSSSTSRELSRTGTVVRTEP